MKLQHLTRDKMALEHGCLTVALDMNSMKCIFSEKLILFFTITYQSMSAFVTDDLLYQLVGKYARFKCCAYAICVHILAGK